MNPVSIESATAAPTEIMLNGKTYMMSPLTDRDYGTLNRFLQQQVLKRATALLPDLSPSEQSAVLDAANRHAAKVRIDSPEGWAEVQQIEGFSMLAWLQLRKHHKDLTREDVEALLCSPKTAEERQQLMQELVDIINTINGDEVDSDGEGTADPKGQTNPPTEPAST